MMPRRNRQRWRIEYNRFLSRLASRQQQTTLEIDLIPFEVQNFPKPRSSENQQARCGSGMRTNDGSAVGFLRGLLGRAH